MIVQISYFIDNDVRPRQFVFNYPVLVLDVLTGDKSGIS